MSEFASLINMGFDIQIGPRGGPTVTVRAHRHYWQSSDVVGTITENTPAFWIDTTYTPSRGDLITHGQQQFIVREVQQLHDPREHVGYKLRVEGH